MITAIVVTVALVALAAAAVWFSPKGWRTVAANAAVGLPMVLAEILNFAIGIDWKEVMPAGYAPLIVIGVNVLNIVLRAVTTTPMGEK